MEIEVPGYRLVRLIAEGGMASVYLAVQESLNRNVALKLLRKFDAPAESERFLNEGRIISSLNHRNIITIHDVGLVGERPFISMELLEGGDLEDRLDKGVDVGTALSLLETLAECLAFVHGRGIIHRDIKPANILFHQDGTPILTDFGIAKEMQADTALTLDGTAIGSPHYLSPEQAECKPLSGRTDIYSLGVVFYQMLVGARPYVGDSAVEVIVAHLSEPVPQLPPAHERYQPLLDRMMAKSPEKRFASATELLDCVRELRALEAAPADANDMPSPDARPGAAVLRSCTPRVAMSVVATGLAITLMLAMSGTPWRPRSGEAPEVSAVAMNPAISAVDAAGGQVIEDPGFETLATSGVDEWGLDTTVEAASLEGARTAAVPAPTQEQLPASGRHTRSNSELSSDTSRARQVDRYLQSARTALTEYRLTTPSGNNARFFLRRALELDPDNGEAEQGLVAVAETYADLVEGALDRFDYGKAKRYLARGLSVQPDNRRLLALKGHTEAHRDAPKRLVKKVRSWF